MNELIADIRAFMGKFISLAMNIHNRYVHWRILSRFVSLNILHCNVLSYTYVVNIHR